MSDQIINIILKLGKAPRSRANMDKAAAVLEEVEELREPVEAWIEAAEGIREHVDAFIERTEDIHTDFLPADAQKKMLSVVGAFQLFMPEENSELNTFAENVDIAKTGLDELDEMLQDRSVDVEDRDIKWAEIGDAMNEIATALDKLSCLGRDPEAEAAAKTDG